MSSEFITAEQSLLDQMGISDREIARRLHFLDFTDQDQRHVVVARELVESQLAELVENYYKFQQGHHSQSSVG